MCTPGKLASLCCKHCDWELLGKCSMSLFAFVKPKPTSGLTLPHIFLKLPTENIFSNFFLVMQAGAMDQQEVKQQHSVLYSPL